MHTKRDINTLLFILICVFIQIIIFSLLYFTNTKTLHLDQVVILSRHGVRTPLSKNLEKITKQRWPNWKEEPGYLTDRGFELEGLMGSFFFKWLNKENILGKTCPSDSDFFVYANSVQRTIYSAEAFVKKAFPKCNITIHQDSSKSVSIFNAVIHNSSEIFKDIALEEMQLVLENLNLTSSYKAMEGILDYVDSEFCKTDHKCSLVSDDNKLDIAAGKKPIVTGPLKLCNEAVDAFLMSYYNGNLQQDIGWGKLDNKEQWDSILSLTESYHNLTFNTSHVAKDIAKPLTNYLKNIFLNKKSKVTLLMGHDANINVLLNTMSFKPYKLSDSFVSTPIGGKIVFQKWHESVFGENYLKVDYVYQNNAQLRDVQVLSLKNPPNFARLELEYCKTDDDGLCLWDDFVNFLNSL